MELYYGQALIDLARAREAQQILRAAVLDLTKALGEKHFLVSDAHSFLGLAFGLGGDNQAAIEELDRADELVTRWAPEGTWTFFRPDWHRGLLALLRDAPREAEPLLAKGVRYQDENVDRYLQAHQGMDVELDHSGAVRQALGEAYEREGRTAEAIATLRSAVRASVAAEGTEHPNVTLARLSLAACLIETGQSEEARRVFNEISELSLTSVPLEHPILAQWNRVNGLLAMAEGHQDAARTFLTKALDLYRVLYGKGNWHVERAERELRRLYR